MCLTHYFIRCKYFKIYADQLGMQTQAKSPRLHWLVNFKGSARCPGQMIFKVHPALPECTIST